MPSPWLNRTVIGAGLTSFLADVGYEMACSLIPSFLLVIGLPSDKAAAVLGAVEAVAEFVSNGAKLIVGWYSDKIGKRKAFVVGGYALTGVAFALIAIGMTWPFVILAKSLAWLGKGIRGPLRNAIISDSVEPEHRGKAFGFHRMGDTCGAVLGPLVAVVCLAYLPQWFQLGMLETYQMAFLLTVIPGLAAAFVFWRLVHEVRFTPKPGLRLGASFSAMPTRFRMFLFGVAVFGIGDFSPTLMILAVASNQDAFSISIPHFFKGEIDGPTLALLLMAWRNLVQAIVSVPAGWLGDRDRHHSILIIGYMIGTYTVLHFLGIFERFEHYIFFCMYVFAMAGIYMAIQETCEPVIVPELVPDKQLQGTAFGLLAAVNGYGDVVASFTVGFTVWYFGWTVALIYAASMMALGTIWMLAMTISDRRVTPSLPSSPSHD